MSDQRVEIAISPCPNDVFIFSGLITKRVPCSFDYQISFADIETLNEWALEGGFDLIKASFAIFPQIAETYRILSCGSAMGFGVGPILVSSPHVKGEIDPKMTVGVPGKHTTANFLLTLFFPQLQRRSFLAYNEIIPALVEGKLELGVLIHEGRFVYQRYGLTLVEDLGKRWEETTKRPLPLGGLFIKKSLDPALGAELLKTLKKSLDYANAHREELLPLLRKYAQELDKETIYSHIETYVNVYSEYLNSEAIEALRIFFTKMGFNFDESHHLFWE